MPTLTQLKEAARTPRKQTTCAELKAAEDRVRQRREALEVKNLARREAAAIGVAKRHAAESAKIEKRQAAERDALLAAYGCTPKAPPQTRKQSSRKPSTRTKARPTHTGGGLTGVQLRDSDKTVADVLREAYGRTWVFPWEELPDDAPRIVMLERDAWVGQLSSRFDVSDAIHYTGLPLATRFLALSDEERQGISGPFYSHGYEDGRNAMPRALVQVILAAHRAGFRVDGDLLDAAKTKGAQPDPYVVENLMSLRSIAGDAAGRLIREQVSRVSTPKPRGSRKPRNNPPAASKPSTPRRLASAPARPPTDSAVDEESFGAVTEVAPRWGQELEMPANTSGLTVPGGVPGNPTSVSIQTSRGSLRTLDARFVLVSASALVPSHDASTFEPRPDYPVSVQERRYDADQGEQAKVIDIAQNLVPGLLANTSIGAIDGTPVVAAGTAIVLGGNGRTMGSQRHYRSGRSDLRTYLLAHATEFGFRRRDVEALADPIVVRAIAAERSEWPRLVRDLNVSLTQVMDATTEAAAQARQLPPDVLRTLADGLETAELGDFLRSRASVPLVGALDRSGFINRANRGRMLTADGLLSKEAVAQLERQLLALLVPDAALLERLGFELRATLTRSAPAWLAAGARGPEWDVRQPLGAALDEFRGLRQSGQCLAQWLQQVSLDQRTAAGSMGRLLLEILDLASGKPVVFSRIARSYFLDSAGGGLFGGKQPRQALEEAAIGAGIKPESAVSKKRCRR